MIPQQLLDLFNLIAIVGLLYIFAIFIIFLIIVIKKFINSIKEFYNDKRIAFEKLRKEKRNKDLVEKIIKRLI